MKLRKFLRKFKKDSKCLKFREWLTRKLPKWKEVLKAILFKEGNIIENAEKLEKTKE